jgi:hypothetical protein
MNPISHESVTLDHLAEALRRAGYRAQPGTAEKNRPVLHSAAQGLGFMVYAGNPAKVPGAFADYSFACLIQVKGELSREVIERWNREKRFGRLFLDGQLLVLAMDVLVAGGVSPEALVAQCELWDRLMHDFLAHLRSARVVASVAPAPAAAA